MIQLFLKGCQIPRPLDVFPQEIGKVLEQIPRPIRVLTQDGDDGVERVEQEMGIDLSPDELQFRHRQQVFLFDIAGVQELIGKQLGYPFAQGSVGYAEDLVFRLEQIDGADQFVVDPERHGKNGAERAGLREAAAPFLFAAVGVDDPFLADRLPDLGGTDRRPDDMVVVALADKGQHLLPVGNGHRPDARFLPNNESDLLGRLVVETPAQDGHGPFRHLQGLGGEGYAQLVIHLALVADDADKDRRPAAVGENHRQGDDSHQGYRLVNGSRDQDDDDHLNDLRNQGGEKGDRRIQQPVLPVSTHQI